MASRSDGTRRDEVIKGPSGDVLVPAEMEVLHAAGFLVRRDESHILLEFLGVTLDQARQSVIARFAFTPEGFQQFVHGLNATQRDLGRDPPIAAQ